MQAALDAIQIHGANGYTNEFPVERYLRNRKAAVIYEGTSQLHTLIQADYALGYREDRPLRCEAVAGAGVRAARSLTVAMRVDTHGDIPAPGPSPLPAGPPTPDPEGWSKGELDTLTAVADTFAAGDAPRRARLAADALNVAADPDQVLQLRLVMRAFDSRLANLLLTGRAVRFRALDLQARETYLLAWATSRIPQRRTAYQGLKRLLTFIAYADPGRRARTRGCASTGYDTGPSPSRPIPRRSCRSTSDLPPAPPATTRSSSTRTSSWWAPAPAAAWSPLTWPVPGARSSSWRPGRSSPSRRCRPTSWRRSTGCT